MAGITKWVWVTIEEYLSYLLPKFEDLVPTSLGSGAVQTRRECVTVTADYCSEFLGNFLMLLTQRRGLSPRQRAEQRVRGVSPDDQARRERDVVVRQGAARVPLAEEGRLGDGRGGAAEGRRHRDAAVPQGSPGTNCIEIGLSGKLSLSKRKGLREILFS